MRKLKWTGAWLAAALMLCGCVSTACGQEALSEAVTEAVSEAAGEAISEEMSMAMINYMPIRGALSFGGGLPEDVVQDMLRQMNE